MTIRKVFHILVSFSLLLGFSIRPATADSQAPYNIPNATAATHTVCANGCDFTIIQAAIDSASDEDIIDLASETYTETITIDKSISISGEGPEDSIIQAPTDFGIELIETY
jgi:pectin methylesterase-like acyl-CoA thioesterase